jgi:hypothetical protein
MSGWTVLHTVIGVLVASLATSLVFSLITSIVGEMEDTSGSPGITAIALVLSFALMLLPALFVLGALVAGGAKMWWAYAAGGVVAALLANVVFIGEFNTRLLTFSTAGGIAGGLAAFLYLKYVGRIWEAANG